MFAKLLRLGKCGRAFALGISHRFIATVIQAVKTSDLFHAAILLLLAAAMFVAIAMSAHSMASFAQHLKRFSTPTPRPSVVTPAALQMLV